MGKIGRIACIATPMALSILSAIFLTVVCTAGWNKSLNTDLYFFKADTTGFKHNITSSGVLSINLPGDIDDKLRNFLNELTSANQNNTLDDIYEVYLWNYCSGNKNSTGGTTLTKCSPRESRFWFDVVDVWGLNSSGVAELLPSEISKGMNIYKKVSQWMFVAYAIAFFATLANIVVGLLAICSRWGSCVTTLVSATATLFSFLAALTSTILFTILTGAFNSVLKTYGIHLTVGTSMFAIDWLAFATSLGATLFWTISICCCSGKSSHPHRRDNAEKGYAPAFGSRGYQPLEGQQSGHLHHSSNVEMSNFGGAAASSPYTGRETAYEPFRHS